jgi:hypothetical protein
VLALCPTSTPVVDPADRGFFHLSIPFHVAVMLRGPADSLCKCLKMLASKLQHARHKNGRRKSGRMQEASIK